MIVISSIVMKEFYIRRHRKLITFSVETAANLADENDL